MTLAETIGYNCERFRKAAKLTQMEVAQKLQAMEGKGWSRPEYVRVANGKRNLTLDHLQSLATLFEVPLTALFVAPAQEMDDEALVMLDPLRDEKVRQMVAERVAEVVQTDPKSTTARALFDLLAR